MIKAVIFDIDDTLYNEIDFVKSGFMLVAEYFSKKYSKDLKEVYNNLLSLFKVSPKLVFNRLLKLYNIIDDKEQANLVKMYREHVPKIALDSNVIELFGWLHENNYKIGIVSDGNYITQKNKCEALKLYNYIDYIVLTGKYGKEYFKPNKKPFELIANELFININEMIYIGDNPKKDFYPSVYGIKTVRFYNKNGVYYNESYLDNVKEDYSINNLCDVKEILKNFSN